MLVRENGNPPYKQRIKDRKSKQKIKKKKLWTKSVKQVGFPHNPWRWIKRLVRNTWKRIDKRKINKFVENTTSHEKMSLILNDKSFSLGPAIILRKTFVIFIDQNQRSIGKCTIFLLLSVSISSNSLSYID